MRGKFIIVGIIIFIILLLFVYTIFNSFKSESVKKDERINELVSENEELETKRNLVNDTENNDTLKLIDDISKRFVSNLYEYNKDNDNDIKNKELKSIVSEELYPDVVQLRPSYNIDISSHIDDMKTFYEFYDGSKDVYTSVVVFNQYMNTGNDKKNYDIALELNFVYQKGEYIINDFKVIKNDEFSNG